LAKSKPRYYIVKVKASRTGFFYIVVVVGGGGGGGDGSVNCFH